MLEPQWLEDAEGRRWYVSDPSLVADQKYMQLAEQQVVCEPVRVNISLKLSCDVYPGQPMPEVPELVRRIFSLLTLGGPAGRRQHLTSVPDFMPLEPTQSGVQHVNQANGSGDVGPVTGTSNTAIL